MNVPCDGTDYYYKGSDQTDDPVLGYLCEAKPLKSSSGEWCHWPFIHNNVKYTSCSMVPVPGFNPDGKPWCATEVNSDNTVIPGKWVICEDEREIIYDGSGAGLKCPLPFLYNGIYFDYCTRKSNVKPVGFNDFYWCPNPRQVGDDNLYTTGNSIGKCTDILLPPGNNGKVYKY